MPAAPNAPQAGPEVDPVGIGDLRRLSSWDRPPCVSILLPTARRGVATRQGPTRLRNQLGEARDALDPWSSEGSVDPTELLAPVAALVDDPAFWQSQADGLAIFAAPGFCTHHRVPLNLAETVHVGAQFRLRPLLPLIAVGGRFHLLALSQNDVSLYEGSERGLVALDSGPMPTSLDEALSHEDRERELQVRPVGGGTAHFHGHGGGGELDKATIERFLRAVDRGVAERIGATAHPLVLACVGYYGPIYRSVTTRASVLDQVVEGNPEHRSAADLHAEAWPMVAPLLAKSGDDLAERVASATGTGLTADEAGEIADRAAEGRVDTLLVTNDAADHDDLDRAIATALTTGAAVMAVEPGTVPAEGPVAALLRY